MFVNTLALAAAAWPLCEASLLSQFSGHGYLTGTSFGVPTRNATYDYVIVGGGIAGSVVAARLTQHSNATVALIEAGSFFALSNGNLSQIPYWSTQFVGGSPEDYQPLIDWGLVTEPLINGKQIAYAQGKGLGGSSGRNQMMYHRPTKGTYDVWAEKVGDDAFKWDNMLPFYKRSTSFSPNREHRMANQTPVYDPSAYSSEGGPLSVTYPAYVNPFSLHGPDAFSSVGMKGIEGFASGNLDGHGWWQFTFDPNTGLRSSAETSFLEEAFQRSTLTTYINAMARNIIFENGTATGVNVTVGGRRPFTLSAKKEVIVSAGAYHSPQLLMVSGVGLRDTLEKFGIPVVSDLPGVGQNMKDTCNPGGVTYPVSDEGFTSFLEPTKMASAVQSLLTNATGALTNIGLDYGAWEKPPAESRKGFSARTHDKLAEFPADWPEIEWGMTASGYVLTASSTKQSLGTIAGLLVAPVSSGNMTIRSNSNEDPPIISPNWLTDPADQEVALASYRRAREIWKAIPTRMGDEVFPGKNVTSDKDLLEAIKSKITPIHHASSSCAMGKKGDRFAVVDSRARVFGVEKLRVIDSSSFPFTPPGHTQGVTYAHAEKLIQDILDQNEN